MRPHRLDEAPRRTWGVTPGGSGNFEDAELQRPGPLPGATSRSTNLFPMGDVAQRTMLLVDDEPAIVDVLAQYLRDEASSS